MFHDYLFVICQDAQFAKLPAKLLLQSECFEYFIGNVHRRRRM